MWFDSGGNFSSKPSYKFEVSQPVKDNKKVTASESWLGCSPKAKACVWGKQGVLTCLISLALTVPVGNAYMALENISNQGNMKRLKKIV